MAKGKKSYSKVYASYWDESKSWSEDARVVGIYLLTCHHRTILGCYRLPVIYGASDLGWPEKRYKKALAELGNPSDPFALQSGDYVCVCNYLRHNPPENKNQLKGMMLKLDSIPTDTGFVTILRELLDSFDNSTNPFETVSRPFANPSEYSNSNSSSNSSSSSIYIPRAKRSALVSKKSTKNILEVFDHYRTYHPRACPNPRPSSKEWVKIRARLKEGRTVEELKLAIDGIHLIPHNCGDNESGKTYQSLELCMRDDSHVVGYMEAARNPPKPKAQRAADEAERALDEWLKEKNKEVCDDTKQLC